MRKFEIVPSMSGSTYFIDNEVVTPEKFEEERLKDEALDNALAEEVEVVPQKVSDDLIEEGVRNMLWFVGENPDREGILETPKRVRKA